MVIKLEKKIFGRGPSLFLSVIGKYTPRYASRRSPSGQQPCLYQGGYVGIRRDRYPIPPGTCFFHCHIRQKFFFTNK